MAAVPWRWLQSVRSEPLRTLPRCGRHRASAAPGALERQTFFWCYARYGPHMRCTLARRVKSVRREKRGKVVRFLETESCGIKDEMFRPRREKNRAEMG